MVHCTATGGPKQTSSWFTALLLVDLSRQVPGSLHCYWWAYAVKFLFHCTAIGGPKRSSSWFTALLLVDLSIAGRAGRRVSCFPLKTKLVTFEKKYKYMIYRYHLCMIRISGIILVFRDTEIPPYSPVLYVLYTL